MKTKKLFFLLFTAGIILSENSFAQGVWDVRNLASSTNPVITLALPDGSFKKIQTREAILIRDIVDRYSKLSGIYPQIYLDPSKTYNASVKFNDKTPVIKIYMSMFDLFNEDKDIAAAVLGHEMAHLYLGHLEGSKVGEIAGVIAGELIGFVAQVFLESLVQRNLGVSNLGSRIGASLGASLGAAASATYSRSQETDADELGIKWAAESGYDPLGAIKLFVFFDRIGQSSSFSFFNTHPTNSDRIRNIRAYAESLKKESGHLAGVEKGLQDSPEIVALNNNIDQDFLRGATKSDAAIAGVRAFNDQNYIYAKTKFSECSVNGELVCLNNLGVIYLNGLGVEKDIKQATKLFKQAGDAGLARAYKNYAATLGASVSFPIMVEAFSKAAKMGSAEAMGTIAYLSLLELDLESRKAFPPEATLINYAKVSAMRGVQSGQLALGTMYRKGLGAQKNLDLAEINLKLAAVKDERADGELFILYDQDHTNERLAQEYKNRIFTNKEIYAMDVVVSNYCRGTYDKFSTSCISWVKDSAMAGASASGLIYGVLLFDGVSTGVKQDRFEGLSWIAAAKSKGNIKANEIFNTVALSLTAEDLSKVNKRSADINSSISKKLPK